MEKTRVSFNAGWRFALTEDTAAVLPDFDDSCALAFFSAAN